MGLLPDIKGKVDFKVEATLSLNDSGRFEDRWIYLKRSQESGARSQNGKCVWTHNLPEVIYLPVAHGEGKFIPKNDLILKDLKKNGQVVFRYVDKNGNLPSYPENPNGSVENIAGICDRTGRILGMMPHPERHVTYLQHPNWRRYGRDEGGLGVGLKMFENGVNFAKNYL
ncbi:MAG: phosphoribosylformylglycinamidine synthase subunit PurQ, partial [Candidatus Omnitrophota bacterium]